MTNLPDGWHRKTLGQVADTALGKMLDRGKNRGLPHVRYLRNINVQWGRVDTADVLEMELADAERERFGVEPGDLLVCEGGEVGRAAIWSGLPGYIAYQKALHRVRPGPGLDGRFLLHQFAYLAQTNSFDRFATGSTIRHLPQQQLRRVPIVVPPMDEQRRIVEMLEDHLSRLDAANDYLATARRRQRQLVRAVLTDAVPDVANYPARWRAATVGEAGQVELGRQRHPDWHHGPNMRPYLRVANVFEDRIDTADVKQMHWPEDTFERFKLRPGDVLLNEGQSPEFLGRPAMYRGEPQEIAFTNSLIRFTAHQDVRPEFALLVFRRHMHAGRFRRESRITTNIAHLSASRLKPVEFPIPPLAEQDEIVSQVAHRLGALETMTAHIDVATARARSLRRSLLAAAFSGRLTGRQSDAEIAEAMALA